MAETGLREIVRGIVAEQAAEETVLLDGLAGLSDDQITGLMRRRAKQRNGPLGFGLPEAVALVTPVVWLVLNDVSQKAADAATEAAADRAVSGVRGLVRRLRRRRQPRRTVPAMTPHQLRLVHAQTVHAARDAQLDEDTARRLADAVVSRLARTTDEAPQP